MPLPATVRAFLTAQDAARPLVALVGTVETDEGVLKGGHVSVAAGANAVKRLWPKLDAWLGVHST